MGTGREWIRLLLVLSTITLVKAVQYKAYGCSNSIADLQKQIDTKFAQTPVWDYFGALSRLIVCPSGITGGSSNYCICPEFACCGDPRSAAGRFCRNTDDYINGNWIQRPAQCCAGLDSNAHCIWPNPKCRAGGVAWECVNVNTQFCPGAAGGGCDTTQGNYCCGNSGCYRPGDGQVCCGGNKLCGSGQYCCNGDCIPWDGQCCDGQTYPSWCSKGNYCTPTLCVPNGVTMCPGGRIGCYSGTKCCGDSCIANDRTCCDNGGSCAPGKWCCGDKCGGDGDDCGWDASAQKLILCTNSKWCGSNCCPRDYSCSSSGACIAPGNVACGAPFFGSCPTDRWCCGPRCGKTENKDSCCWSKSRSMEYLCTGGKCCGDYNTPSAGCCREGWRCVNDSTCEPPEGQQLCPDFGGVSCPNDQWCCGRSCGGPGANGDSCCWNPALSQRYLCKNSTCCGTDQCCTASQECVNNQCVQKPVLTATYGVWKSMGCYTDSVNARALSNVVTDNSGMSVARCAALAAGRKYMGVEYGVECHFGDSIASTSSAANDGCTMRCAGKNDELCGGGDRLNMYVNSAFTGQGNDDWSPLGCYTDSSSNRALPFQYVDWNAMTVEMCLQQASGFAYAAVEYYGECYFGNTLNPASQPATGCNTNCAGNTNEMCGGSDRINLYRNKNVAPVSSTTTETASTTTMTTSTPTTTSTTSTTTTTTTTSTTTASGPTATVNPGVGSWESKGCWSDNRLRHALTQQLLGNQASSMDAASCVAAAKAEGYKYAGVENSGECWADFILDTSSASVTLSRCDKECNGKHSEICGGADTFILYQDNDFVDPSFEVAELAAALTDLKTAYVDLKDAIDAVVELLQNPPAEKKRRELKPRGALDQAIQVMKQAAWVCRRSLTKVVYMLQKKSMAAHNYIRLNNLALEDEDELLDDAASATSSASLLELEASTSISLTSLGPTAVTVLAQSIFFVEAAAIGLLAYLLGFGSGGGTGGDTGGGGTGTQPPDCDPLLEMALVIMCKDGTTDKQYEAMIRRLPGHPRNVRMDHPTIDWRMYRVVIKDCDLDSLFGLTTDPASPILTIVYDEETNGEVPDDGNPPAQRVRKRIETEDLHPNRLYRRAFTDTNLNGQDRYLYQPNAPHHLNWMSNPNARIETGRWYDIPDSYVFLDSEQGTGAVIYIMEQKGYLLSHKDYQHKVIATIPDASTWVTQAAVDFHGTCVASIAAGWYSGASKGAKLVLVKPNEFPDDLGVKTDEQKAWKWYQALAKVVTHAANAQAGGLNYKGKAVVNISQYMASRQFVGIRNTWNPKIEWWAATMNKLDSFQIALVVTAGNDHPDLITKRRPRGDGGSSTSMVVVGSNWLDNERATTSQFLEPQNNFKGVLSIYANGKNCDCADWSETNSFSLHSGTSFAAPAVAGVIANMLISYPNEVAAQVAADGGKWGLGVKNFLIQQSVLAKGATFAADTDTPDVPRASWGKLLPCAAIVNPNDVNDAGKPPVSPLLDPHKPSDVDSTTRAAAIATDFPMLASGKTVNLLGKPDCVAIP